MVVPVADQAAQQIRPPQERAVRRRRAAEDDVVAAAGAGVAAVEHELLGAEPRLPRLFVERRGLTRPAPSQLCAGCMLTSITPGSGVTLKCSSRGSDGGGVPSMTTGSRKRAPPSPRSRRQIEIVLRRVDRRHEDVKPALRAARRTARCESRRWPIRRGDGVAPGSAGTAAAGSRASLRTASCRTAVASRLLVGSGRCSANGSTSLTSGTSSRRRPTAASRAASESRSANRRESGTDAPGAGTTAPLVPYAPCVGLADSACSGSTYPTTRSRPCSKTRASRARSSSFFELRLQRVDIHRQPPLLPAGSTRRPRTRASRDSCRRRQRVASAMMNRRASASPYP